MPGFGTIEGVQRTFSAVGKLRCWLDCVFFLWVEFRGGVVSQSHVLVWHSLLFTLAILRFHLFDIVTCSHSFHTLLVLLFYKCSLVPICNFVSYSYLNRKPAQHWCSDCCPVTEFGGKISITNVLGRWGVEWESREKGSCWTRRKRRKAGLERVSGGKTEFGEL